MNPTRPTASQDSTVLAILKESARPGEVPFRNGFVQGGTLKAPLPGPMAEIVRRGRERALDQYMLAMAWASGSPHDVRKDSRVWSRAIGLDASTSSRAAVSRNWTFLAELKLVSVTRQNRLARVQLLKEDGTGREYENHPGGDGKSAAYFKVPFAYWTGGHYKTLGLGAKAVLLIALSRPDRFALPTERAPQWYGISDSTATRGFRELRKAGLITVEKEFREAPLSPEGYTAVNFYTLQAPFGPKTGVADEARDGDS